MTGSTRYWRRSAPSQRCRVYATGRSPTKKREALFIHATALEGPNSEQQRPDFSSEELKSGRDLYFAQQDNRSSEAVVYRMKVRILSPTGFVVDMNNITPARLFFAELYPPGSLRSIYFLMEGEAETWNYYSLMESGSEALLASIPDESYKNRAVALFRRVAGIPTDQEPPAAR